MSDQPRFEARPHFSDLGLAIRISLVLWAIGLSLFVVMAVPVLEESAQVIDDAIHSLAVDLEYAFPVAMAKALDFVGSTPVTAPLILVVGAWLAFRKRWQALTTWVLAMTVSQLFIGPVKNIYDRPRPPMPLVETSSWSFPSGHAVAGAAIAVALVIVLIPPGPKRRGWEVAAASFAVAMALSRVYLRAHWLTDVVAGASLGVAIALASGATVHWLADRRVG